MDGGLLQSYAPKAQTNSDCRSRVLRGGSWWDVPILLRSGSRDQHEADSSDNKIGFRVARTIGNVAPLKGEAADAGGYVVQVSSQKSEADAQTSYRALQGKYPSVLGSQSLVVKRVDLGKKGVYYRAFAGPFSSADQATQVCNNLKAAGGPQCLIQRN